MTVGIEKKKKKVLALLILGLGAEIQDLPVHQDSICFQSSTLKLGHVNSFFFKRRKDVIWRNRKYTKGGSAVLSSNQHQMCEY